MRVKQYKGTVYGAELTAKERRAMNIEINRQIVEADRKYLNNVDAMILYFLHKHLGFGKKRLRRAWEQFTVIHDDLVNYYEMPDDDAYRHGNAGSISGLTGNGKEIAIHNHPRDGWPTFSKEDVINTALGTRRGIVAVSTKTGRGDDTARYAGVYTFTKGTHFNASGFVKAVNSAQLSGKDYNDAVSKWLKANQQKFGYKYSYQKAK